MRSLLILAAFLIMASTAAAQVVYRQPLKIYNYKPGERIYYRSQVYHMPGVVVIMNEYYKVKHEPSHKKSGTRPRPQR